MSTGDRINRALQKAAHGDERAWRDILEAYGRRVFGLIRARCGDPDLAEEITQSCFCTVADKLCTGSYLEQGKFEAWIFRIAVNRLRDEKRRQARQAMTTDSSTLAALADRSLVRERRASQSAHGLEGDGESRDSLRRREQFEALSRALELLPEADAEVLHLRHQGGLAFKQIAEALGQPLGTVLARHHRALSKLRHHLDEMEK